MCVLMVRRGQIMTTQTNCLVVGLHVNVKRCLKIMFPGYPYENILQILNLPTLHRRRDELCRAYFAKMKSNDHKLNALVPNGRCVPYALRLCNKLSIPRAKPNRYKNSLTPWCLEHFRSASNGHVF